MIKINLVKTAAKSQSSGMTTMPSGEVLFGQEEVRREALKKIVIFMVFPLGLFLYENQTLPPLRDDLQQKQTELSNLQTENLKYNDLVVEIEKFKQDESQLQKRIATLDRLSKDRMQIIRILDLFQLVIPEKAWLTKLDFKDAKVLITGFAMTDADAANFLDALTKSVFLIDVNLVSSNEVNIDGLTVKKFEISAWMEKAKEVATQ